MAICVKDELLLHSYKGTLQSCKFKVEINGLCSHKVCLPRLLVVLIYSSVLNANTELCLER